MRPQSPFAGRRCASDRPQDNYTAGASGSTVLLRILSARSFCHVLLHRRGDVQLPHVVEIVQLHAVEDAVKPARQE